MTVKIEEEEEEGEEVCAHSCGEKVVVVMAHHQSLSCAAFSSLSFTDAGADNVSLTTGHFLIQPLTISLLFPSLLFVIWLWPAQ